MTDTCDGDAETPGCGRPIEWVEVAKSGAVMPIDRDPVANGNIVKVGRRSLDRKRELVEYRPVPRQPQLDGDPDVRFVSHFATCEFAEQFRRNKKNRKGK